MPHDPTPPASGAAPADDLELAGQVGPYRILEKLGEGAFGAVYRAEQRQPMKRVVALKLIKPGMDSRDIVLRFGAERQALALMDHPNIAKIYDAGSDARGRPYFVMEFVPGQPITRWCDERALGLTARVQLFVAVCDGVQHAHQKGIIHRDLSARNVLVTEHEGKAVPKVIDFGVAKSLSQPLTEGDLHTMKWQIFGTPEYMSPEQARSSGRDIDTRTDVYALGVLLYELLTGALPISSSTLRNASPLEWSGIIRETVPPLPSTRFAAEEILGLGQPNASAVETERRQLRGELDWIVMKAISKEREQRYPSAAELGADLRRHLADEPVLAGPPSTRYRLAKFVRKHRGGVTAAALALALLIGTTIGIARLWIEAEDARSVATENATLADRRLTEVLRLSDLKRLADLEHEAQHQLWPAHPRLLDAFDSWLLRARELEQRLPRHRESLAALRARAMPAAAGQTSVRFADTEDQWQHDMLAGLVAGLEALVAPERGRVAEVVARAGFARTVHERTITAHAERWAATAAAVAAEPRYASLALAPQLGLIPLGRDPDSGLFEFAHLQTGAVPERDDHGRLQCDAGTGIVFVLLPAARAVVGAAPADAVQRDAEGQPDEAPVHAVALAAFFLSKHEMTQAQWLAATGTNPSYFHPGRKLAGTPITLRHPVEQVTWLDADACLRHLALVLPTEAQWEYACRAGTGTPWSFGPTRAALRGCANLADAAAARAGFSWPSIRDWPELDDGWAAHAPVGTFPANAFGLHELHGNVWEWTRDSYGDYALPTQGGDGERKVTGAEDRTFRGGSFYGTAAQARSADRNATIPSYSGYFLGLRPARAIDE